MVAAYLRRADESTLGRAVVGLVILLAAMRGNPAKVLQDAAAVYKVHTDAIVLKARQEFAAKRKQRGYPEPPR